MKRYKWSVVGLLVSIVLGGLASLGSTNKASDPQTYHLAFETGSYYHHAEMKAGWEKHFGIDSERNIRVEANLRITPNTDQGHRVKGTVVVKTPNGAFPITLGPDERLPLLKLPDGRSVYYGALSGNMTAAAGKDELVAVGVVFVPGTSDGYMTVAAGTIEDGAEFVFGKSFLTPDDVKALHAQLGDEEGTQ